MIVDVKKLSYERCTNLKKVLAAVLLVALLCTGCASGLTVTTEQNDLLAEYTAGVLMKYSFENEWNTTKLNKAKKAQGKTSYTLGTITGVAAKTSGQTTTGSTAQSVGTKTDTTTTGTATTATTGATTAAGAAGTATASTDAMKVLADGLGLSAASITYSKYVVGDTYPTEQLALSVPATEGNKIVAIELNITNSTANQLTCNVSSSNLLLKLAVNSEAAVSQTMSMLKNDVLNMNGTKIDAGQSVTAIALFMVPTDKVSQISSLSLTVTGSGATGTKKLQ